MKTMTRHQVAKALRAAAAVVAEATFDDFVNEKTFKNPKTGNKVKFHSLPSEEQKKVYEEWKSKEDVDAVAKKLNLKPEDVARILRNPRPSTEKGKAAAKDLVKSTDAFNEEMSSIKDDKEAESGFKATVRELLHSGGGAAVCAGLLAGAAAAPKWVPQALDAAQHHPMLAAGVAVAAALSNLAFYARQKKVHGAADGENDLADRLWDAMVTPMTEETMPKAASLAVALVGM